MFLGLNYGGAAPLVSSFRLSMQLPKIISLSLLIGFTQPGSAAALNCENGDPVATDIGGGVILRTCMWQKEPDVVVRTGTLELVKNGVLILRTQTNSNGKLHGQFTSWSDAGVILQKGMYVEGLKQGIWIVIKESGNSESIHYRDGVPVVP